MRIIFILVLFVTLPFFNIPSKMISTANPYAAFAQEPETEEPEEVEGEEEEGGYGDEEIYEDEDEDTTDNEYYTDEDIPEWQKYYREKYDTLYDASFETVWNAIKSTLEEWPCAYLKPNYRQTDDGLYKGSIQSEFCVFTEGTDSSFRILKRYSLELPFIRGGVWVNGRIQFKFLIRETNEGKVFVNMKTEMSGMEDYVTHEFHFWKSNGLLEHKMLLAIEAKIAQLQGK